MQVVLHNGCKMVAVIVVLDYVVTQWVGHQTCYPKVAGLTPGRGHGCRTMLGNFHIGSRPSVGSRPSDHYFCSVCLFVCLCRVFLSRL